MKFKKMFNNEYFRVYRVDDLIGVEIGGSIKNVPLARWNHSDPIWR